MATPTITLTSGAATVGSGKITLTGLDYAGRNVSKVIVTIFSGTTTTKLAEISFVPGTTFPIGSGVGSDVLSFANSGVFTTSGLTMFADLSDAPASNNASVVYEYKYYLASKEVVAVLPDKQSITGLAVA